MEEEETYIKWDPLSKRYVTVVRGDRVRSQIGQNKYREEGRKKEPDFQPEVSPSKWEWDPITGDWKLRPKPNRRLKGQSRIDQVYRLAERDGWTCHWCGVDLSLNIRNPLLDTHALRHPTIDHVVEVVKGGTNEDSNCVLACADCNNRRSGAREPK